MSYSPATHGIEPSSYRPPANAWWRPTAVQLDVHGRPTRLGMELDEDPADGALFMAFARQARLRPDSLAVQAGTSSVSYGALLKRSMALAARIDATVGPQEAVATVLADPVDTACGLLACLAADRPCLVLNAHHPPARLADILADGGVTALIVAANAGPCALPTGAKLIPLTDLGAPAEQWAPKPARPDDPCLVIYTSGSTGRPKGIVRSGRQMLFRAMQRISQLALGPADRALTLYPLSAGPGVTCALAALLSGGSLHVADVAALGARGILDLIADAGITAIAGVTPLLRTLFAVDGAGAALATLRSVYTSSESLLRQDVDRWRPILPPDCGLRTGYGLTEGAPLTTWIVEPHASGDGPRMPIGYPLPCFEYAITDAAGRPVPLNQSGELWVRGRLLSLGEWRGGRCVPGRLLADPDDPLGAVLRTGDLVRLRPDGLVDFLGRIDDQIRIRGNRVEPAELERVLRQSSDVADTGILARRQPVGDPVLVAFVVAATHAGPTLRDDLKRRLAEALPSYMLPSRVHLVAAIPKLPGGKVDFNALQQSDDAFLAEVVR